MAARIWIEKFKGTTVNEVTGKTGKNDYGTGKYK